jgi:hypothetical protein
MTNADLITYLQPDKNRYAQRDGATWRYIQRPPSAKTLEMARRGEVRVAFYAYSQTVIAAVDIDHHIKGSPAWRRGRCADQLRGDYDDVVTAMNGVYPTMLTKSPRGLHCRWRLSEQLPTMLVVELVEKRLSNLIASKRIEVLPTQSRPLAIPSDDSYLNPRTLKAIEADHVSWEHLHPALLFDEEYTPSAIREKLIKPKYSGVGNHSPRKPSTQTALKAEKAWTPLANGKTNEALCHLIPAYRAGGLTANDIIVRLQKLIMNSPKYAGDLREEKVLRRRVRYFYKKSVDDLAVRAVTSMPSHRVNAYDKAVIENLCKSHPFAPQRTEPIRRFLLEMVNWKRRMRDIYENESHRETWSYLYPNFKWNMKLGYVPFPQTILLKWNRRYWQIIAWLKLIGFLEPYNAIRRIGRKRPSYSSANGMCIHYRIYTWKWEEGHDLKRPVAQDSSRKQGRHSLLEHWS